MHQQGSDNYAPEMLSFGASRMPDGGGGLSVSASDQPEAASPISSRPPAGSINFDELASTEHDDHRTGGGSGGNRWPRQETMALLKIRSEMDVAFRDATLKGPLWDEVSRKLGELGYVRSAKKCKEKFENVHKYYKRTKEGRAGRPDGKNYRFFSQLEAMEGQPPPQTAPTTYGLAPPTTSVTVASASAGNVQFGTTPLSVAGTSGGVMPSAGGVVQPFFMYSATPVGISFSSDSASSDSDDEVDDDMMSEEEEEELNDRPGSASNPKRKRSGSAKSGNKRRRMMDFFEGLMKQVMQKQEVMQQKFLETIEKREQDRLMREEARKQLEAARLGHEQQLAAQERALAASRDAAIVSFLHKITGQTVQLPPQPQPQPQPYPIYTTTPPTSVQHVVAPRPQQVHQPLNNTELMIRQQQIANQMPPPAVVPASTNEVIMAVPERQIPPLQTAGQESSSSEPASSSRWPKAEVLALIKLRSSLENRYQEAGPKGPLWEEISSGMQRMGYNRSSKRCKEKWENINKYFKRVKESNKKRSEDAKTCPYFNELDALYQRKKLGSSSSSTSMVQFQQQQGNYMGLGLGLDQESTPIRGTGIAVPGSVVQQASGVAAQVEPVIEKAVGLDDQVKPNLTGAGQGSNTEGGSRKPEDIMMEPKQLDLDEYNQQKMDDEIGNNDDDESEEEGKMAYKIDKFQRPPTNNKSGGTSSSSFSITMVQ